MRRRIAEEKTLGVVKKEEDILSFPMQILVCYEKSEITTLEDVRHAVQLEREYY